ncbi:hypothetical protein JCM11672_24000 [Alkaliphilus crotonatoxidans]
MAVGDQLNDLSMIKFAGLGVALGNGAAPVIQIADLSLRPMRSTALAILFKKKFYPPEKNSSNTENAPTVVESSLYRGAFI